MLQLARTLTTAVCVLSCVAPALSAQTPADEKEIAAYRLTMAGLKKYEAVSDHLAAWAKTSPEVQAKVRLEARIDSLRKKDERTDKEQERLEALEAELSNLEEAADEDDNDGESSITGMEKKIASYKPVRDALAKAGMPGREYAVFTFAIVNAAMHAQLKKQGNPLPKDANAANIAFFEQNAAAIQALNEKMEKVSELVSGAMKKGS